MYKATTQHLNETVWCTLAPSPIHGIGVFALRDIQKGQTLHCLGTPNQTTLLLTETEGLAPEILALIRQRWPLALEGSLFQSPNDDARLISFMNHSDTPNYDKYNDTALTDIRKGEEITEDYGYNPIQGYVSSNNGSTPDKET